MFILPWMRLMRRYCLDQTFERWAFEQLELPPRAHILELGANTGQFWYENRERIPTGWEIEVTDTDPVVLDIARKHLRRLRPRVTVGKLDIFRLPQRPERYDAVVCNHMFHLMPYQERAFVLDNIWRYLVPGGVMVAGTCAEQDLEELRAQFLDLDPELDIFDEDKTPFFSIERGDRVLEPCFNDIKVRKYVARLEITDADVLVDGVRQASRSIREHLVNDASREFRDYFARLIECCGPLRTTRQAGLFICRK
ncbi:methyltransferase domain-containing protein [Candidatus Uhrbacteria bacterium]|nr:methyltransferase domain-containing protein [Candidatus Uhrbacteria bacterium]